jgi:tryptophanyl-tRNA synthetase
VKTSLTGIKPTNTPHLGNYLGAIRPALELARGYRSLYFIADYHAVTTVSDPKALHTYVYDVAATWLASGLDPSETILFRQSAIPEVFELAWILSCQLGTGQLERGHAYKDALEKGGEKPNAGVFYYPVLMAADILLYDTHVVPVGKDQKQHLELCRDVALRINHVYGEGTLVVPEAVIAEGPLVPGTDGEKMSKSRGNTLPLFADEKALRKMVMKIKTTSESLEEPKTAVGSTVYELLLQLSPKDAAVLAERLSAGGFGWGDAKQMLFEAIDAELGPKREHYNTLRATRPSWTSCWRPAPSVRACMPARPCAACETPWASGTRAEGGGGVRVPSPRPRTPTAVWRYCPRPRSAVALVGSKRSACWKAERAPPASPELRRAVPSVAQ